jgi:hypothetical protein
VRQAIEGVSGEGYISFWTAGIQKRILLAKCDPSYCGKLRSLGWITRISEKDGSWCPIRGFILRMVIE